MWRVMISSGGKEGKDTLNFSLPDLIPPSHCGTHAKGACLQYVHPGVSRDTTWLCCWLIDTSAQ